MSGKLFVVGWILLAGCGGSEKDKPTKLEPPAESATGGNTTDAAWDTRTLCLAPDADIVAEPDPGRAFRREDSFGNERWGAAYSLEFGTHARQEPSGRTVEARAEASVSATLAGKQQALARAVLASVARDGEPAKVSSDLVFLDRIVYPLFEFTGAFTHGDEFTQQMMEVEYPLAMVGEIEVGVEVEAWVTLGYQLAGQAHIFGLSGKFVPHAAVAASGGVSVGDTTQVVEAGLRGHILLADLHAPVEAGFLLDPTMADPQVSWLLSCGLDLKWLSGNLTVYAELAKTKEERVIAEWPGFESSRRMAIGSGSLVVSPPSSRCDAPSKLSAPLPRYAESMAQSRSALPQSPGSSSASFEQVLEVLSASPAPGERAEALSALKRIFRRGAVSSVRLRPALEKATGQLVTAALGADGSTSSLRLLLEAVNDVSLPERTRIAAAAAFGLSSRVTSDAFQSLRHFTTTSAALDETVTYAIANAANTLASSEPALAEAVASELATRAQSQPDERLRVVAVRALGNLRVDGARRALADLKQDEALASQIRSALARAQAPRLGFEPGGVPGQSPN